MMLAPLAVFKVITLMFGVNRPPLCAETNFLGTRDTSLQIYGTKQLTEDVFKSNVKTSLIDWGMLILNNQPKTM